MAWPIMPTPTISGKDAESFIKSFLESQKQDVNSDFDPQPRISAKKVYENFLKIKNVKK